MIVTAERRIRLVDGPRIKRVRSSANPLFETAAAAFGDRLLAVVLTGGDGDGTDGVQTVAGAGGVVVAQDPRTAQARWMPESAIATGAVRHVLPLDEIGPYVVAKVTRWAREREQTE